jgi:hypothetical protein
MMFPPELALCFQSATRLAQWLNIIEANPFWGARGVMAPILHN